MGRLDNNNSQNNAVAKQETFKQYANSPAIQNRFREVLGAKAPQFVASVISAVNSNELLQKAEPASVFGSAMIAASLNLSIVGTLGQAAIVPYKENKYNGATGKWETKIKAQFQIMTRGLVQLGQRSGQYQTINADAVYEDEYEGEDLLTGEVRLKTVRGGQRDRGEFDKIVGFFAYFRTTTGFTKTVYWTKERVFAHALRYSKSKKENPDGSFTLTGAWQTNFDGMARKTVLKSAITNYGPMSVDTQLAQAIIKDQLVTDDNGESSYLDNPMNDVLLEDKSAGIEKTAVNASTEAKREITPTQPKNEPQPKESAPQQTTAPQNNVQTDSFEDYEIPDELFNM